MLEKILDADVQLFVYLNNLGSPAFDFLWLQITKQLNWLPLFLLLLYLIYKQFGVKKSLYILLSIALLLVFTDQVCNLFKNGFERLRPCNNPEIISLIRIVKTSHSFSFFSGHASNSMAVASFLYPLLKPYYSKISLLFVWPLIFAYSRIYLGLHYPIDIVTGYVFGFLSGCLFYKMFDYLYNKFIVKN